jgi:lambda family phage minor tail protein L
MSIQQDVQNSWHEAIVELFELDLEPITEDASDKFYFTGDIFPDGRKIVWQGNLYEPFPIAITGFETTTKGTIPQPELAVANVLGTLASAVNSLDDLVGAKITRRRTLGKYLDNGTSPDPSEEFPLDVYYIERKISETNLSITWQLASKIDLEGLQLPRRVITQNYCIWKYRGAECGYSGPPVANDRDQPLQGDDSGTSQAYLDALSSFNAAKTAKNNAEYQRSAALAKEATDCDVTALPIAETFSKLTPQYSLGLVVNRNDNIILVNEILPGASQFFGDGGGTTLAGVVSGVSVDVTSANADYRPTRTVRTGWGEDLNKTGPVYQIDEYVPASGGTFVVAQSFYSKDPAISFAFRPSATASGYLGFINGNVISLVTNGAGYRLGSQRAENVATVTAMGLIDKSEGRCGNATTAKNNAITALNAANAALQAASNALDAAAAALPTNSALLQEDVCGKRLNSCKLRFGRTELPFGGFPGANIVR